LLLANEEKHNKDPIRIEKGNVSKYMLANLQASNFNTKKSGTSLDESFRASSRLSASNQTNDNTILVIIIVFRYFLVIYLKIRFGIYVFSVVPIFLKHLI